MVPKPNWFSEYAEFGTLIRYLAMRDLRLRYRHASLGALWVILQPLLPMLIFAGIFARVLRPSSGDVPYSFWCCQAWCHGPSLPLRFRTGA